MGGNSRARAACACLRLPCPVPPHSNPRHFTLSPQLTSPHVRPPPCLCCPVFEDHLALPHRPPPAINALPTHPYLAATVRYARPRLKHHRSAMCASVCAHVRVRVCALGHRPSDVPGTIAWHRMASHGVPWHRSCIPSRRFSFIFSLDTCACVISCLLCCVASRGPNCSCSRIAATHPPPPRPELPLPLTCGLLCPTCYKSATEPRFSTQRNHSARTARLTRSGDPAQSGSGFAPSVASWACGRALVQASKQASLPVLSCAPPRCHPQQPAESILFSPRRPAVSSIKAGPRGSAKAALAVGWRADPSWWVLPTCSHNRDLADGWEWRQPLPSDRFASASLSWFV